MSDNLLQEALRVEHSRKANLELMQRLDQIEKNIVNILADHEILNAEVFRLNEKIEGLAAYNKPKTKKE